MRLFFAVALLLCAVGCASNPKPSVVPAQPKPHDTQVWIKASPAQSFAPGWIHIRIHADAAPENRLLSWMCDSGDGMRFSSDIQLDGEKAQQTFDVERKGVTGGEYECVAALSRQGLSPIYAHGKFIVIAPE